MSNKTENINKAIDRINNNEFNVVFSVPDTKGSPKGSVAQTFIIAKTLFDNGYNVIMLYENTDFTSVGSWLGEEYDEIPTQTIEENTLQVTASDILIIPEMYGHIVEQTAKLPINRVVMVRDLENMLDLYTPGKSWSNYGVDETIVISDNLKELVMPLIRNNNIHVVPPIIDSELFFDKEDIKQPLVAIHTENTKKAAKIIKEFYLKFPALRWISFKDIHAIPYAELNNILNETCVSVWLDHDSSFGTFPIESIKSNTPVIALVPHKLPPWYNLAEDSVIWSYDETEIPDYIAKFLRGWLEDSIPAELEKCNTNFKDLYNLEEAKNAMFDTITSIQERRMTLLTTSLEQIIVEEAKEN